MGKAIHTGTVRAVEVDTSNGPRKIDALIIVLAIQLILLYQAGALILTPVDSTSQVVMHVLTVMQNVIFVMAVLLQIVSHACKIITFLMIRLNVSVDLVLLDMVHNIRAIQEDAMI